MIRALTSTSIFVTSPGRRWPGNRPRNRDLRENDHRSAQNLNGSHDWAWGRHRSFWVDGFDWAVALATTHYSRGGVTLKLHIETRGIHNLSSVRTLQPIVASPSTKDATSAYSPPPPPRSPSSRYRWIRRERREILPAKPGRNYARPHKASFERCCHQTWVVGAYTEQPGPKPKHHGHQHPLMYRDVHRHENITKRRVGLPQNPWGLRQPYVQSKLPGDFPPVGVPPKVLFFALSILV